MSKDIYNIHPMFTLGWRLNIRMRKNSGYLKTRTRGYGPKLDGVLGKNTGPCLFICWNMLVDLGSRLLQRQLVCLLAVSRR